MSASSSKVTLDSPSLDETPVHEQYEENDAEEDVPEGMHPDGFSAPKDMVVKPLTPEAIIAKWDAITEFGMYRSPCLCCSRNADISLA